MGDCIGPKKNPELIAQSRTTRRADMSFVCYYFSTGLFLTSPIESSALALSSYPRPDKNLSEAADCKQHSARQCSSGIEDRALKYTGGVLLE